MASEKKFTIGEAIGFGWETFKGKAGILTALVLILLVIGGIFGYLSNLSIDANPDWVVLINIASIVVNTIVQVGVIKLTLELTFSREVSLGCLFTNWRYFFRYLIASILYALIVVGGLVLFIVPGVIWGIKYSYFGYNIVEKDMGIIESLQESSRITMGYKGKLFWFNVVSVLLFVAGFVVLGVGIVVTYPIILVAKAYIYKELI